MLEALRRSHAGAAPPTVYRALDFLIEHGLIHRIESLNAYVGCPRPERPHVSQFLICGGCGATAELDDPAIAAVLRRAAKLGFLVEQQTIELPLPALPAVRQRRRGGLARAQVPAKPWTKHIPLAFTRNPIAGGAARLARGALHHRLAAVAARRRATIEHKPRILHGSVIFY